MPCCDLLSCAQIICPSGFVQFNGSDSLFADPANCIRSVKFASAVQSLFIIYCILHI